MPPVTAPQMGDASSWALFILSFVSQLVLWIVMLRGGFRKGAKDAATEAQHSAEQNEAIKSFIKEVGRLASGLEQQTKALNEHIVQDTKIHERLITMQEQFGDTVSRLTDMAGNMQRQITNVALGIAPAEATPVPASRARQSERPGRLR